MVGSIRMVVRSSVKPSETCAVLRNTSYSLSASMPFTRRFYRPRGNEEESSGALSNNHDVLSLAVTVGLPLWQEGILVVTSLVQNATLQHLTDAA